MTDDARRTYLRWGRSFVAIGVAVAAAGVLDALLGAGFFRGNPLPTALFLASIGAALWWTAARAPTTPPRERSDRR
jgi:hypothetical protein